LSEPNPRSIFARTGIVNIGDEVDRTREFSPFVIRILMKRANAVSYYASLVVEIFEAANVVCTSCMLRLRGWWMRNGDEVKWRSVM
jgi:hypothetical protein